MAILLVLLLLFPKFIPKDVMTVFIVVDGVIVRLGAIAALVYFLYRMLIDFLVSGVCFILSLIKTTFSFPKKSAKHRKAREVGV